MTLLAPGAILNLPLLAVRVFVWVVCLINQNITGMTSFTPDYGSSSRPIMCKLLASIINVLGIVLTRSLTFTYM